MRKPELPVNFERVFHDELDEIRTRRKKAGLAPDDEKSKPNVDERVGLALSGGGVRSASFNLGLIQALYEQGVLRQADYLSTVSGGGYVGSLLSSLAVHPGNRFDWQREPPLARPVAPESVTASGSSAPAGTPEPGCPLAIQKYLRQPPLVAKLIHGGMYLRRPILFIHHYLTGLLLINLFALSSLLAIASLAAYVFRWLDDPNHVMRFMNTLGFRGDVLRAFAPALAVLLIWVSMSFTWALCWALATEFDDRALGTYFRKLKEWHKLAAPWVCFVGVGLAVIAFAALLTTGDINLDPFARAAADGAQTTGSFLNRINDEMKLVIGALLVIALLPYVRVKELIRSGTKPRTAFEGWVFAIASRAFLYGIPLVLFGLIASENISRHQSAASVRNTLDIAHIANWPEFWERVRNEAVHRDASAPEFAPSRFLVQVVGSDRLNPTIDSARRIERWENDHSILGRWWKFATCPSYDRDNLMMQLKLRSADENARKDMIGLINAKCLSELGFYSHFSAIAEKTPLTPDTPSDTRQKLQTIKKSCEDARALEKELELYRDRFVDEPWENLSHFEQTRLGEVRSLNRTLLGLQYGAQIRGPSTVFARVVQPDDQRVRLKLFWFFGAVALISGTLVSLNGSSLHAFYRDLLAAMWIADHPEFGRRIPLSRLDTTAVGAPYHLMNACMNRFGRADGDEQGPTATFLFSKRFTGSVASKYAQSSEHEQHLDGVMALSGAAVSPGIVENPLIMALLFLLNLRLGQWVRNPSVRRPFPLNVLPPAPLRLACSMLIRNPEERAYCFVSDGGHHENLGIAPLLQRRCRIIIASDAGYDPDFGFIDFMKLLRRSESPHGVRFVGLGKNDELLNLDRLLPDKSNGLAKSHFVVAKILYPKDNLQQWCDVREGYLIYVKPSYTGDESLALRYYRNENAAFPHDPTLDQFYDSRRFYFYVSLGYHIGRQLCREMGWEAEKGREQPWLAQWNPPRHVAPQSSEQAEPPRPAAREHPHVATAETINAILDDLVTTDPIDRDFAFMKLKASCADSAKPVRETAVAALLELLRRNRHDTDVQMHAISAVGEIGGDLSAAIECLRRVAADSELPAIVRQAAEWTLFEYSEETRSRTGLPSA